MQSTVSVVLSGELKKVGGGGGRPFLLAAYVCMGYMRGSPDVCCSTPILETDLQHENHATGLRVNQFFK